MIDEPTGNEADTFRRVAGRFSELVAGVPADGWSDPAPCSGWVARDVVRHLVEWVPAFFESAGVELGGGTPAVDDDPAAAWGWLRVALEDILEDETSSSRVVDLPHVGPHTMAVAIDRFVTADVLVHTWDLARATGQDPAIDGELAGRMLAAMENMGDVLVASGHYAPAVAIDDGASIQDRLVAATGRDPAWTPPPPPGS